MPLATAASPALPVCLSVWVSVSLTMMMMMMITKFEL